MDEKLSAFYSYLRGLYSMMGQFTKYIYFNQQVNITDSTYSDLNITSPLSINLNTTNSITLNAANLIISDNTNSFGIYYGTAAPTNPTPPVTYKYGSLYIRTGTTTDAGKIYIYKKVDLTDKWVELATTAT
jgi:hypothetical protein